MHEPEVMFLDEPTTGLDPNSRAALWEEIRDLNAGGTTVFLTTQYMEEADRLCNRVAIIDNGRIVAEGTPRQLKAEVGDPTLRVALGPGGDREAVEATMRRFGEPVPDTDEFVSVRLHGGAGRVAEASRALEEAGLAIEGLELHNPTLDDVFHQATGRRLEGSAEVQPEVEAAEENPET
jgi:ABC-2 type transport system ATP-binding protein